MVLLVKDIPTTLNEWIKQASKFHVQQKRIATLQEGGSIRCFLLKPAQDLNTMDINTICLSSVKRADNMYFIYYKVGYCTKNHPQDQPHNQGPPHSPRNPAWVRVTTTTLAILPAPKPKSELAQFVESLEKKGTIKKDILWVLLSILPKKMKEKWKW